MSRKRSAEPAGLGVLLAILKDHEDAHDFRVNLELALQVLPEFLVNEAGVNDCAIQKIAEDMLDINSDQPFWRDAKAMHQRIQNHKGEATFTHDEQGDLSRYGYQIAGAAFALGFAAGVRFGGGR